MYVPADKTISLIPDLAHLPDRLDFPTDNWAGKAVLVVCGMWMIVAPGLALLISILLPAMPRLVLMVLLLVPTTMAIIFGIAALRQIASFDETVIREDGLVWRHYKWFGRQENFVPWEKIDSFNQKEIGNGYTTILASFHNGQSDIPVFLAQTPYGARRILPQLKALIEEPLTVQDRHVYRENRSLI